MTLDDLLEVLVESEADQIRLDADGTTHLTFDVDVVETGLDAATPEQVAAIQDALCAQDRRFRRRDLFSTGVVQHPVEGRERGFRFVVGEDVVLIRPDTATK